MGVLDDAIREHLELKRRHGASEDEVSREEQEALGPPQREQPAPSADEPQAASAAPETEPADQGATPAEPPTEIIGAGDPEQDAEELDVDDIVPVTEPSEPQPKPPEPEADSQADAVEPDWGFDIDEPVEPESERQSGDTPPRGFEQVEEAPLPAEDAGEEDVLEETPDFLQDTPEHDRLWFEQKPPRDFDFDDE